MTCYAEWKLNHNKDICINKLLDFSTLSVYCCFLNYPLLHQQTDRSGSSLAGQMRTLPAPQDLARWILSWSCWRMLKYPRMHKSRMILVEHLSPHTESFPHSSMFQCTRSLHASPSLLPFIHVGAKHRAWEKASEVSRHQSHCIPAVTCFENAMG